MSLTAKENHQPSLLQYGLWLTPQSQRTSVPIVTPPSPLGGLAQECPQYTGIQLCNVQQAASPGCQLRAVVPASHQARQSPGGCPALPLAKSPPQLQQLAVVLLETRTWAELNVLVLSIQAAREARLFQLQSQGYTHSFCTAFHTKAPRLCMPVH